MEPKKDYYEVLGVNKNADDAAIKKAYRKLAKKYHPDTNQGNADAEKKFKEVNEAYDVLGDKEKRKLYDQYGQDPYGQDQYYSSGGPQSGYQEFHFEGSDMDDIMDELFGNAFRGSKGFQRKERSVKGKNIETEVPISFEEAVFGCDKRFTLESGDGSRQSLEVHIPAGIADGQSVRLKGKGQQGYHGENGDLLIKVKVGKKYGYERKRQDVYTTVKIPYTTAVFGGETKIHTLYGDVLCKIRPGTQSGSKIRLKGKGIVAMNNPIVHGDEYAEVQIEVPTKLNVAAREKLQEYERACG